MSTLVHSMREGVKLLNKRVGFFATEKMNEYISFYFCPIASKNWSNYIKIRGVFNIVDTFLF